MRALLDPEGSRLTLVFTGKDAASVYLAEVRAVGGLQVALDRRLSQYDVVTVHWGLDGRTHEAFKSYAARITGSDAGSFETAFVVQDWSEASAQELLKWLDGPLEGSAEEDEPAESGEFSETGEPDETAEPCEGEVRGVAAIHRIQKMNMGQKAIRAQRADRAERQVLLRDTAPQVLQGLLLNPRVEAKDILRIAKSTYATGAILQRIAGDARWGKNQEILAAIVRNPKSPTLVVMRLIDKLRTSDLRTMAKMSSGLKEVVRKAALREYLKRAGQ